MDDEAFLQLLTDALRAGPGSPSWREAVHRLRESREPADELQLLLRAREHLESGKSYRSIAAGPGFTRNLMTAIEQDEDARRKGLPIATIVAVASSAVVLLLLALGVYMLLQSNQTNGPRPVDLANVYFASVVSQTQFDSTMPAGWRTIGAMPIEASHGLRIGRIKANSTDYRGGGVVCESRLPVNQPSAIEVSMQLHKTSNDILAQVFITDNDSFSQDRATSPHELVWYVQGKDTRVLLPDGRIVPLRQTLSAGEEPVIVRIAIDRDQAIINCNGVTVWSGPHGLANTPRYAGLRFLARGNPGDRVVFNSIRVLKP
jgi:hypothetical protein